MNLPFLNKIADTNKSQSGKSCPHGLKYWSVSNFFLFFGHFVNAFEGRIETEICLNGFGDMKTMRIKHYFNQNSWYK